MHKRGKKTNTTAKLLSKAGGRVMLFICIGINVFYLLAVLSPYLSGRLVLPSLLGLAFPLTLLLELFVLAYWLLSRKWVWVTINLLLLLSAYDAVHTIFPMNSPRTVPVQDSITIVSYNVSAFGFVEHTRSTPNPILKYLKETGADIVCLQESRFSTFNLSEMKSYLPLYKYTHSDHAQPDRGSRLTILSKWPIQEQERIAYPSRFNGSIAYQIMVRGRNILVINNHLESFKLSEQDQKSYSRLAKQGEAKLLSYSVARKLIPAFATRAAQAERVAKYVAEHKDLPVISCGDFNDTPLSYTRHCMSQGLKDAFKESGYGLGLSFHSSYSKYIRARLDYILYSSAFESARCKVDNSIKISDHYPIVATLYFPEHH